MTVVEDAPEAHDINFRERAKYRPRPATSTHLLDDRWPDRCAAIMMAFAVFVVVVAVVEPWRDYMERPADPVSALTIPIVPSIAYAALLLAMAVALRRRLRAAWWLLLVWWLALPEVARVVNLARGGSWLEAVGLIVAGAAIFALFRARSQFTARHTAGNLVRATAIFAGGGTVVLAAGSWLVMAFGSTNEVMDAVIYTMSELLADLGRNALVPEVTAPLPVHLFIGVTGAAVFLWATSALFRPPRELTSPSIQDEARLHAMVRDFGEHDSLGYFATRRDKVVVWDTADASTARAGVSHRVVGSVSLASGNPVGDPRHWDEAIARWHENARTKGLSIAVMGAGEAGAAAYVTAGLTVLDIGDEAILNVGALSPGGLGTRSTRQAASRLQRRHYTTSIVRHEALAPSDFKQLSAAASEWRGDGGDERGFSMALGRLGDPLDGQCVLVQAHDAEGHLRGFLSFVPWGRNGLSLDLMRRDPTADNGLVELMITALVERSSVLGIGRVSLNFAMFREAFERGVELGAGPVARLWRRGLVMASRTWQLESLYRANAKYRPQWQPRFICFEYTSDLPRVGTAAGSAEGFLTRPSISRLWGRGAPSREEILDGSSRTHADLVRAMVPAPADVLEETLSARRLPEQVRVRRAKVDRLRAEGIDPYPVTYSRTHTLAQVRSQAGVIAPNTRTGWRVAVTGRVMRKRVLGGLGFAILRDATGELQVMVDARGIGADEHRLWRQAIDLGDHVGVTGEVITTRSGELSVSVDSITLTSKSLRPMPDKHQGLSDPEARVRQRHLDLIVRPEASELARTRATVVRSLRDSLHARGFIEVETPVLQQVHGGANARPFQTHVNAYDLDMYLRIASELHLKRLVVGGLEQVFEIGRQFRNEGADSRHNPEFTSLEVYETYRDYHDMRVLTQELIQEAATAVYGAPLARRTNTEGITEEFDLSGNWPVKTICEAVSEALGEQVTPDTPREELSRQAALIGIEADTAASWGFLLEAIYGQLCESVTTTPVFFTDFPKENAPLTREHRDDPRLAEKWDLVMFGSEQGTAYSELIDPFEQRRRLVAQSLLAAAGDPEAMQVDEDFLQALEYGMPPTGGMGLGVDRLVMNLTGVGIRDTILFPIVRPNGS